MEEDIITYSDKLIKTMNKNSIRIDNFHNSLLVSSNPNLHVFKIPLDDLFIKYRNHLLLTVTSKALSREEFFRPKLVSYNLYGTTEYWLALLRLNLMKNVTEFCLPQILVFSPNSFIKLIDLILQQEGRQ